MMRPIETHYHGYRFRSRLEARWAVFFEKISIPWQYEPEGFILSNKKYYLPDFYLPTFGCYIEIKPTFEEADGISDDMRRFAYDAPIVCFTGPPSLGRSGMVYCNDICDSGSGGAYENEAGFAYCNYCHNYTLTFGDDVNLARGNRVLFADSNFEKVWNAICEPLHRNHHRIGILKTAVDAARSARFEHGEKPD